MTQDGRAGDIGGAVMDVDATATLGNLPASLRLSACATEVIRLHLSAQTALRLAGVLDLAQQRAGNRAAITAAHLAVDETLQRAAEVQALVARLRRRFWALALTSAIIGGGLTALLHHAGWV